MESEVATPGHSCLGSQSSKANRFASDAKENRPPLFMQRPSSSAVDPTSFSFSKPSSHPKGFSLRNIPKQGPLNPPLLNNAGPEILPTLGAGSFKSCARESPTSSHPESNSCQSQEISTNDREKGPTDEVVHMERDLNSGKERMSGQKEEVCNSQRHKGSGGSLNRKTHPRSTFRSNEASRVTKPRRENKSFQMSEDRLFELLIAKIRLREEKEFEITATQQRLEKEMSEIKRENQGLRGKAKIYDEQILDMENGIKSRDCQLTRWKEKILKFKHIVNDLGHDFEALRLDSDKLKATTSSLQDERRELVESIDEIRTQIIRSEETMESQRMKITDHEKEASRLEQALLVSEDRLKETLSSLAEEKQRNTTLESYIQNYSRVQIRQTNLLRADHTQLMEKLVSGLDNVSASSADARDLILSSIRSALEECRCSVEELREKCSAETRDVQDFNNTVHDVAARLDALAARMAVDMESVARSNLQASDSIGANTKMIECSFGPESVLLQQISRCNNAHESLDKTLGGFSPMLSGLDSSVKLLAASGNHLMHELKVLDARLPDSQNLANKPSLEQQLSKLSQENVQLQALFQSGSCENASLRAKLDELGGENKSLKKVVADSHERIKAMESSEFDLKAERIDLHEQLESTKGEAQKVAEYNEACRKELQLHHDEQIESFQQDKDTLEKSTRMLIEQLEGIQESLANAQITIEEHRQERTALTHELEQQVQSLEHTKSESAARELAQTVEIQRFQESEAASCSERNDLQERLRQAHERIHELEQSTVSSNDTESLKKPQVNTIVPFSEIQNKFSYQRNPSPFYDPGDFAMLFMSDDLCPSSPFNIKDVDQPAMDPEKDSPKKQPSKPPALEVGKMPHPSPKMNKSPAQSKRKAVNFKPQSPVMPGARTSSARSVLSKVQNDQAERPNKVTKHVHKWTYSRIRSSGTEVQHEGPADPSRMSTKERERRVSPEALVSANGGSKNPRHTGARSRGKRQTRGERYNARFSQEK